MALRRRRIRVDDLRPEVRPNGRLLTIAVAALAVAVLSSPEVGRAEGPVVTGWVEDVQGTPLQAEVELRAYFGGVEAGLVALGEVVAPAVVARATSSPSGRFELQAPEPGPYWLHIVPSDPGWASVDVRLLPLLDDLQLAPYRLPRSHLHRVRVVDASGRGVPGATVLFHSPALPSRLRDEGVGSRPGVRRRDAKTDSQGWARVRLPAATRWIRASHPSFLMAEEETSDREVTLQLTDGVPVVVRLTNSRGRPAAGALVEMGLADVPITRADGQGIVVLQGHPEATVAYQVSTADGDYANVRIGPTPARPDGVDPPELSARFNPPRRLSGTLLSKDDRRAIEGGWVWSSGALSEWGRSDARGRFVVESRDRRASEEGPIRISAAARGFVAGRSSARGDGPPVDLVLESRLDVRGVVLDPSGRPLSSAVVRARPLPSDPSRAQRDAVTLSGLDGTFQLPTMVANRSYEVVASVEGLAPFRALLPPRELASSSLRIQLGRASAAKGRVLDESQSPIEGARVELARLVESTPGTRTSGPEAPVVLATGPEGLFAVAHLDPGSYRLRVEAAGFATAKLNGIEIPQRRDGAVPYDVGTVTLSPGEELEGIVVDPDGQPISEVEIRIVRSESGLRGRVFGGGGTEPDAVTGEDGRFELGGLLSGEQIGLVAEAAGFVVLIDSTVPVPSPPLRLEMEQAARLIVRVIDEEGNSLEGGWVASREQNVWGAGTTTHTLDPTGEFVYESLSLGRRVVEAGAQGFVRTKREVLLERPEEYRLEIRLERGLALRGTVRSIDGDPVSDVLVSAKALGVRGSPGSDSSGRSDGAGVFVVEGLKEGEVALESFHPGYVPVSRRVELGPDGARVDLILERGLTVRGEVVTVEAAPAPGTVVQLQPWPGGRTRMAESDAEGRFALRGLTPGEYEVLASHASLGISEALDRLVLSSVDAELRIELTRPARIVGHVVGPSEDEMARYEVRAWGPIRENRGGSRGQTAESVVDYSGRFELAPLATGRWHVTLRESLGSRSLTQQVDIPPGQEEVEIEFEVEAGLQLRVLVTSNGEPAREAQVSVAVPGELGGRSGYTDSSGEVVLRDLPSERVSLNVHLASGRRHHRWIHPVADDVLQIDLLGSTLEGRMVDAETGEPVAGGVVHVLRGEGTIAPDFVSLSPVDDAGRFVVEAEAGTYRLLLRPEGRVPRTLDVDFPGSGTWQRTFEIERGRALEIHVLNAASSRLRGSLLELYGANQVLQYVGTVSEDRLRFEGTPSGTYRGWLVLSGERHPVAVNLPAAQPVPVQLAETAELWLEKASAPSTDETGLGLYVLDPSAPRRHQLGMALVSPLDGTARVFGLPEGSWIVELVEFDKRTGESRTVSSHPVTLIAGQSTTLEVP